MKHRKRECDRLRHLQKILFLQLFLLVALFMYLHPASGQAGGLTGALGPPGGHRSGSSGIGQSGITGRSAGQFGQTSPGRQVNLLERQPGHSFRPTDGQLVEQSMEQSVEAIKQSAGTSTEQFADLPAGQSGRIAVTYDPDGETDGQSEPCEELARQLAKYELDPPQGYGNTRELVKDIAILTLQLEEVRLKYARLLQLNAEGVLSANILQTELAAYERVQVQLAGKVNNVRAVLDKIIQQRKLANDLQEQMAVAYGRRSHVAKVAPAKKPAPSEVPGRPPQPL